MAEGDTSPMFLAEHLKRLLNAIGVALDDTQALLHEARAAKDSFHAEAVAEAAADDIARLSAARETFGALLQEINAHRFASTDDDEAGTGVCYDFFTGAHRPRHGYSQTYSDVRGAPDFEPLDLSDVNPAMCKLYHGGKQDHSVRVQTAVKSLPPKQRERFWSRMCDVNAATDAFTAPGDATPCASLSGPACLRHCATCMWNPVINRCGARDNKDGDYTLAFNAPPAELAANGRPRRLRRAPVPVYVPEERPERRSAGMTAAGRRRPSSRPRPTNVPAARAAGRRLRSSGRHKAAPN